MHACPPSRPPNIIGVIRFDSPGEKNRLSLSLSLPLLQQSIVENELRSHREFSYATTITVVRFHSHTVLFHHRDGVTYLNCQDELVEVKSVSYFESVFKS